ncbi:MAG: hypothetical protein JXR19_01875 [Bacteroidia bacterium]
MKLISSILTLILLSINTDSFSQEGDFQLEWGEKFKSKKTVVYDILAPSENGFYAVEQSLRLFNRDLTLSRYEDNKPIKETELLRAKERGVRYNQTVFEMQGNLFIETLVSDKQSKVLTADRVDKETLEPFEEDFTIFELDNFRQLRYSYSDYFVINSLEETYRAYVIEEPGANESKSSLSSSVFDSEMNLVWESSFSLPYIKELSDVYAVTVSETGAVYVLMKVYKDKKKDRRGGERNYKFYILSIDETGLVSKEELVLGDKFILDLELGVNTQNEVICGGFYSVNNTVANGVFYMALDSKSFGVLKTSLKKFEVDFLSQGMSKGGAKRLAKKDAKGKDLGLSNISFRDFVLREDGGLLLIGEYQRIQVVTTTDANGGTSSTTHYHFNDIYVININPNGDIDWAKKILKRQHTQDDGAFYSSFFLVVDESDLHFIFNDHPRNVNLAEGESVRSYRKSRKMSTLMTVTMNADGDQNRYVLVPAEENDGLLLRPRSCEQVTNGEFILFALNKKYNRFARVKMN